MDKINYNYEYSKCPLKKRPIYVINEEMEVEDEEPMDLTTKTLNIRLSYPPKNHHNNRETAINYSTKLETIKEEDNISYNNYEDENSLYPQYTNPYQKLEYQAMDLSDTNMYEESSLQYPNKFHPEMTRNFNNNFISNRVDQNFNQTSTISSSISPQNNITYQINYIDDFQAEDLSAKSQLKSILSTRNQNLVPIKKENYSRCENDLYYRCNICTKCYSTYGGLLKHQQSHSINNDQSYINVIENTQDLNNLVTPVVSPTHLENLNNQKILNVQRYQCKDCGKSYSTYSGLTKHQQFHCPNVEGNHVKKVFSCKNCDKVYVSLGALKMHIRTHTLPCKCPQCGKAFSRPWLLQGHIRTHTGEKPFSCQHCNRAFADRSNLRAHLQTHSDIKKYSCPSCTKTFSRMSLLGKHLQSGCPGNSKSDSNNENLMRTYDDENIEYNQGLTYADEYQESPVNMNMEGYYGGNQHSNYGNEGHVYQNY